MDIFNQLSIGIQIIDSDMRYIFLNKTLLNQVNKTLDDHLGKKMEEVYPDIEQTKIYESIQECLKNNQPTSVNNEFLFEDGRRTFWELSLERIDKGVLIISRDVTNLKEGEKLLLESNQILNRKVKEQTKELLKANDNIKKLLGYVAHDIRSPLGTIINLCEAVEDGMITFSNEHMKTIRTISEETLEMAYTILESTAINAGKLPMNKVLTDISKLVERRLHFFRIFESPEACRLNPQVSKDIKVNIDPVRIEQVISNLISNAIKYSPQSEIIDIILREDGFFCVKNKIDFEKQSRIKSQPRNVKESVGFGLDIVKTILELHSFELHVEEKNEIYQTSFWFS